MSAFVLDCSVAVAWCFDDEARPETDALLIRARDEGAVVPALWFWEVGNVLVQGVRRGRITPVEAVARLELLSVLPITVDGESAGRAWREARLLAQNERLSLYDAAYLELASRRGGDLATTDGELRAAAGRLGVRAVP